MPDYDTLMNGSQMIFDLRGDGEMKHVACCGCGLDHLYVLTTGPKKGFITITVYRDDYQTELLRKAQRFECKPKKK